MKTDRYYSFKFYERSSNDVTNRFHKHVAKETIKLYQYKKQYIKQIYNLRTHHIILVILYFIFLENIFITCLKLIY